MSMPNVLKSLVALVAVAVLAFMVALSVLPNAEHLTLSEIQDRPVRINSSAIPDDAFRTYVINQFDANSDGFLSVSERENVVSIGSYDPSTLAVSDAGLSGLGVSSLEGIELFPNLTTLVASNNSIASLDISSNVALENIDMRNNGTFVFERVDENAAVQLVVDKSYSFDGDVEGVDLRYG